MAGGDEADGDLNVAARPLTVEHHIKAESGMVHIVTHQKTHSA